MSRILIIDDEESICNFFKKWLNHKGFDVLTATNGDQGLKLFNESQVDLVITDIVMPEKDGFEVIIELKRACPDIKIIAMSGGGRGTSEYYLDTAKCLRVEYEVPLNYWTHRKVRVIKENSNKEVCHGKGKDKGNGEDLFEYSVQKAVNERAMQVPPGYERTREEIPASDEDFANF